MRRALLLVVLALALVPGAAGGGAAKTIGTRGKVLSISADGRSVAVHAALEDLPFDCHSGSVWVPATGRVVRFTDTPCGKQASERQYDSLTLAGSRTVWTDYDFGNHAYCRGPLTATLARPAPRRTGLCPDDPDNQDMYWEFKGDGALLVARSYFECNLSCDPDETATYDADVTIWRFGPTPRTLVAAKRNTKLLDVDAGRILLRDPAPKLLVLNATGRQIATLPIDAKAAWFSGPGRVSVPSGTTLRTYDVATGALVETCTLAQGAKLQDVEGGLAVYLTAGQVHLLTIATNADRVLARQRGLVQADLEPGGVFYAYNVPGGGSKPGRVTYLSLR